MDFILNLFNVNNTFLSVLNYQMSYIEFFGTLFYLWSVWLAVKNNIWTWPIGNIGVVLFGILFYQIRLYSDVIEEIYFLITGFYGWWAWQHQKITGESNQKNVLPISYNTFNSNLVYAGIIVIISAATGYAMSNIHVYFPIIFPEPAALPYLDAFTTIMSFAANLLMARRKIECWYLWIFVDILNIGIYAYKNVLFISLLYVLFLILATKGLLEWRKDYRTARIAA